LATAPTFFAQTIEQLTLFVKQAAWLNTIPSKAKRPRRETKSDAMPQIEAGAHLLEILFEVGPSKSSGMGAQTGIDEIDLVAWQYNQGISLTPWEAKAVRTLSKEYAHMLGQASDATCPPPWVDQSIMTYERRQKIADAMSSWADSFNVGKTSQ
jgi:hypothetical protein